MSSGMNQCYLLGHLGADPELMQSPDGQSFLKFRMATSDTWTDKQSGEKRERTDWHRVVLWGKRAEPLSKILRKGSQVMVEGQIRTSSYEKNGEKRTGTDIHVRDLVLTNRPRRDDTEPPPVRFGEARL